MKQTGEISVTPDAPPDHTQLPDEDGAVASNFQEHPQSALLNSCLRPRLQELYGERFAIGCDSLIYWLHTDPPLKGSKAPDWFLVPGVPKTLEGVIRRSYVLWKEAVKPLVVIEYVSGDGSEERDATPNTGKFWVYEQAINASYYVIFDRFKGEFEVHHLIDHVYHRLEPNAAGRVAIPPLRIEVGLWEGRIEEVEGIWLRAWDAESGQLLPSAEERESAARERAEAAEALIDDVKRMRDEETERAEKERKRAERFAEKLRHHGIDPDAP